MVMSGPFVHRNLSHIYIYTYHNFLSISIMLCESMHYTHAIIKSGILFSLNVLSAKMNPVRILFYLNEVAGPSTWGLST